MPTALASSSLAPPRGSVLRAAVVCAVALLASVATLAPLPAAAVDVGVSIGLNQPGVYGRVDIGRAPPPPVLYPQPIIISPGPVAIQRAPVYLYVPPGHAKHWSKHCARYGACNQPVYFVQENWVRDRYQRYERERPGWRDDRRTDRDDRRGYDKDRRGYDKDHRGYGDDRRGRPDDHPGRGRGRGQQDRD